MDKATELLARYATESRFEDLPAEVVRDAKRKLIDTLGCAIGAFDDEPCSIARALARRCVGRPPFLEPAQRDALVKKLWTLDEVDDVRTVLELLAVKPSKAQS